MEGLLFFKNQLGKIEDLQPYSNDEERQSVLDYWKGLYNEWFDKLAIEEEIFDGKIEKQKRNAKNKSDSPFKKGSITKSVKLNRSHNRRKPNEGGFIW